LKLVDFVNLFVENHVFLFVENSMSSLKFLKFTNEHFSRILQFTTSLRVYR
jgi:hypothetical protein